MTNRSPRGSRRRMRWMSAIAAGVAIPLALVGCTSPDAPSNVPEGEVGGTLNMWIAGLDSIDDASVSAYEDVYMKPFQKLYPNVTFNSQPQNDEGIKQKILTALAAGQGPDIIDALSSSDAIPFAQAGYLEDLGPLAEQENWKDTIFPWAMDVGVVDGKLVALPVNFETLVLFYNKTLFEENGWTPPTNREELETLAGEMEAKGITPFTNANADYVGATEHVLSSFLNMVAGPAKMHDALTGDIKWTDPAFVESVELMTDYFDNGWFSGGVKQYFSTTDPVKYGDLVNGKAAMFMSGSWEIGALNDYFNGSGQEWDWAPLPSLDPRVAEGVYPLSIGATIAINSASQNKPAAEAYVKWRLTNADDRWTAIKEFGDLPLPVKFDASTAPADIDPRFIAQYEALSDASIAEKVGYVTWTSLGAGAEAYVLENEDKLLTHDLSAKDFLKGVDDAFQKDLGKGLIPPVYDTKG